MVEVAGSEAFVLLAGTSLQDSKLRFATNLLEVPGAYLTIKQLQRLSHTKPRCGNTVPVMPHKLFSGTPWMLSWRGSGFVIEAWFLDSVQGAFKHQHP